MNYNIQTCATEFKLTKKDALHNLLFVMGFNAFGGLSLLFLALLGRLGSDTTGLQQRLRAEAREKGGANLSFDSVKEMELIQGFVYESLRFQPTVPTQYGRAKKDKERRASSRVPAGGYEGPKGV